VGNNERSIISIRGVSKHFGTVRAVDGGAGRIRSHDLADFFGRFHNSAESHLEMFEKWRDPMFIDTAHHHYRLRLEIDAFVGAASSRDFGRFMSALRR